MVGLVGFTLSYWRLWVRNFSSSIAACVRVVTASLARTQSGQHLTRLNVPAGRDGAVSGADHSARGVSAIETFLAFAPAYAVR